jgi:hypothetical protein
VSDPRAARLREAGVLLTGGEPVLYHIRIAGPQAIVDQYSDRLQSYDIVSARVGAETVLSCRLPDTAALTALVALLHDLDLPVTEMAMVPDIEDPA